LTVTVWWAALSERLLKRRRLELSVSLAGVPDTSPPVAVVKNRRRSAAPATELPSISAEAFIGPAARIPPGGITPTVIACGCRLAPPSAVRST